eukprot:3146178-Lingulodinium_polyedra.AAC.1
MACSDFSRVAAVAFSVLAKMRRRTMRVGVVLKSALAPSRWYCGVRSVRARKILPAKGGIAA